MIVKMTIPRLLGSSDDKKKIGVARPEGPPLRWFRYHSQYSKGKATMIRALAVRKLAL